MATNVDDLTTNDNFRVYSRSYRGDGLYSAQLEFEAVYEVSFRGMLYNDHYTIYGEKPPLHLAHHYSITQTGKRFVITRLPTHRYGNSTKYIGRIINKICGIDKPNLPDDRKAPRIHVSKGEVGGRTCYKTHVSLKVLKGTTCDEITAMLDLGVLVWKLQEYEKQAMEVKAEKEKGWKRMRELEEDDEREEEERIMKNRVRTRDFLRERLQSVRAREFEKITYKERRKEKLARLMEEEKLRLEMESLRIAEDLGAKIKAECNGCEKVVETQAVTDKAEGKGGGKKIVQTEGVPDKAVCQLDKTGDDWVIVDDWWDGDGRDIDNWDWIGDDL